MAESITVECVLHRSRVWRRKRDGRFMGKVLQVKTVEEKPREFEVGVEYSIMKQIPPVGSRMTVRGVWGSKWLFAKKILVEDAASLYPVDKLPAKIEKSWRTWDPDRGVEKFRSVRDRCMASILALAKEDHENLGSGWRANVIREKYKELFGEKGLPAEGSIGARCRELCWKEHGQLLVRPVSGSFSLNHAVFPAVALDLPVPAVAIAEST